MTRRDRLHIIRIAPVATLFLWGLFAGMTAGSEYQEDTNSPFSGLSMLVVAVLVFVGVVLAIAPLTRDLARVVGMCAAAFVVAVLLGHLFGNRGPGTADVSKDAGATGAGESTGEGPAQGGGGGGGRGRRR